MEPRNLSTDANGVAAGSIDQTSNAAHDTINRVSDAARPAVDRVAASAHQAVDSIASAANRAADTLNVKTDQLKDTQQRLMESCSAYVQENPLAAIGIAVAAGFLLSRVISSR